MAAINTVVNTFNWFSVMCGKGGFEIMTEKDVLNMLNTINDNYLNMFFYFTPNIKKKKNKEKEDLK